MKTSKQRLKQLRESLNAERKRQLFEKIDKQGIVEFGRMMRESGPKQDIDKFFSRLEG